ncbi:MAG: serine hydrolase [Patescibacteria group bacterium]|jgi:beta-lactamase class A|nr:class A beta-lactamase-related serine hydrolase [bacterium]HQC49632.1 class A beta-lactamase-related serine hydrolase [bacterium]
MKLNNRITRSLTVLVLLVLIFSAFLVGQYVGEKKEHPIIKRNKYQANYKYISPLLECTLSKVETPVISSLKNDLNQYIAKVKKENNVSDVAVYLHDLNSDNWLGINLSSKFSPASLLKVPILIAFLKVAETNPEILKQTVTINNPNIPVINPNITPFKSIQANETYTIEELINYTIHYSDNYAANTLVSLIDPQILTKVYTDIGLQTPGSEGEENFMTVADYSTFFEILYNASYLNKEMSEKALEILTKSTFNYGLVSGVPAEVEVAHKFGERIYENFKQLHDCGIVYKENNPYLLCIMTRGKMTDGDNFNDLAIVIKKISEKVYNSIGK